MPLLKNISVLYRCCAEGSQSEIHAIENAAIAWNNGIIEWVGPQQSLPAEYPEDETGHFDAGNRMVIPGLVDCHTHLAFGGWRPEEFEMRVKGISYLDIAKKGGGILSTVRATREAEEEELFNKASYLLEKMIQLGVTTVECKSGYGLSLMDELKTLRVYKRLSESIPAHIVSTFLGAHTLPSEFKSNRKGYIELVTDDMIPAVAENGLAEFCDIFVEESAFTRDEAYEILETGKQYGMQPKVHADQITTCGGAELAAGVGAISADHLEKVSEKGISAMAEAGVVGVTLPLASLYTQEPFLDCRRLLEGGVEVAVGTDFNPGTAPSFDLSLAMMLSCNLGRLTPAQVLKGATIIGAKAIGLENRVGSIEKGKSADFVVVDAPSVNFWMYNFVPGRIREVFVKGEKFVSQ